MLLCSFGNGVMFHECTGTEVKPETSGSLKFNLQLSYSSLRGIVKMNCTPKVVQKTLGVQSQFCNSLVYRPKSYYPDTNILGQIKATISPAITILTIDINLIRMLRDGPEVSLNGSPTVSPTIVAL